MNRLGEHEAAPKVRDEHSDSTKTRGRQQTFTDISTGQRLESLLGDRPTRWLADQTGIPENTIRDAKKRGIARVDIAVSIAKALQISVDELLTGRKEDTTIAPKTRDANSVAGSSPGDPDVVQINEIDLAYGLGGTYSTDPVAAHMLNFPRTWVEAITSTPPSMLTFARGRGDSMQPTIQDGDMLLIDRSQRLIREQDAIWALTIGEFAMVKRVRAGGERVRILSDNDRVPTDDVFHEEVNVVGRVIFVGRRI